MALLILGLILWTFPHLMKEMTPGLRAKLPEGAAKGIVAISAFVAVALMVIGYRGAEFTAVYTPPSWGQHANNLLMLIAVVLIALGHSKSRLRSKLRHPMLTGSIVWGVAHLLVRGDLASIILFGGIIIWSFLAMALTNVRVHDYVPYAGGSAKGDLRLVLISIAVFAVIAGLHTYLGYSPFPG
ncbi:MAG: putative membrane protein [Halocynthiibacter sp.]|jgi:uncharacterized membrane protein